MPKTAARRKAVQRRPTRHNALQRKPQAPTAALMRIPAPPAQPWTLTLDEVALVKNHVAKGASDEELKFCLAVARRRKLDPFKGQIWFVKRNDKTAEGGARWIPMTSIDGLCHIAARDHRDYGTNDEPEFGPMKVIPWSYYDKSGKINAPEWARIAVWKKGAERPTVATVYWDEIYPNVNSSPMVREKPRLMLGKCALAQAIRRAYPDTGGLYIPEEFQGREELTPEGRQIVRQEPESENPDIESYLSKLSPEDRAREEKALAKQTPAQRAVVAEKLKSSPTEGAAKGPGAAAIPRAAAPVLYYIWDEYTQMARIERPEFPLKQDMKAILLKLVRRIDGEDRVLADAEQFEKLKYECQTRGIELKRRREPGE